MTKSIVAKNLIIYADDDPDDLQLVLDSFSQFTTDVEVITFPDGVQALFYLQNLPDLEREPCLIILDINMPRLNGKEALIELRKTKRFQEVPVVLFTTSSLQLDKSFAERYKAGFLTKPIDIRQMEIITDQFIRYCKDEIRKKIKKEKN